MNQVQVQRAGRASRGQVRVSAVLRSAVNEETTQNTYLFGKSQTLSGLPVLSKIFLAMVLLETAAVVGLTIQRISQISFPLNTETRTDFTFGILLFINAGFSLYYSFHGCLKERAVEIYAFLVASATVAVYVVYQYLEEPKEDIESHSHLLRRIRFYVVLVFEPLNWIVGIMVSRSFGWLSYKIVGANKLLSDMFTSYCTYLSVLKLDVQAGINFVVMTALMNFIGYVELGFDIVGLVFTLLWACASWAAIRYEKKNLLLPVYFFSIVEPLYIAYKLVTMAESSSREIENFARLPIIITGFFALLIRILFFLALVRCYRNFGKGLKNRLIETENASSRETTPILGRTRRGSSIYEEDPYYGSRG
eukprot:Nk52_evm1s358 gene=Nk52_evmTU1s358